MGETVRTYSWSGSNTGVRLWLCQRTSTNYNLTADRETNRDGDTDRKTDVNTDLNTVADRGRRSGYLRRQDRHPGCGDSAGRKH